MPCIVQNVDTTSFLQVSTPPPARADAPYLPEAALPTFLCRHPYGPYKVPVPTPPVCPPARVIVVRTPLMQWPACMCQRSLPARVHTPYLSMMAQRYPN